MAIIIYLILVLFSSHHSVWATRFLPMIIWDHLNPLLSCECNWLVIPNVDLYDQQQFTCPTTYIYANLLDGYTRPNTERNENIFRRRWPGTKDDLINMIRNGTIHSFCDPTNSDASKLFSCKDGSYRSYEVTYKYDDNQTKMYAKNNIYVFFNNGDDGKSPSLQSKKARCTMFFAVSVTTGSKALYGMNFGKPAMTGSQNCKLSTCPRLQTTANSPTAVLSTFKHRTNTKQLITTPTTKSMTTTITAPSTMTTVEISPKKYGPQPSEISSTRTLAPTSIKKPVTRRPKSAALCIETWVNGTILGVFTVVAFVVGIVCTVFGFVVRKALHRRDHYDGNCGAIGSPTSGSPLTDQRKPIRRENHFSHEV